MAPLAKAIDEIMFRIPSQVLREVFKEENPNWRKAPISMDEVIKMKVIRPRVLVDCNLVGGQMVNIPLDTVTPDYVDNYSMVYHVPKELTQNRQIISALSIGYMPQAAAFNGYGVGYGNVSAMSINDVSNAAQRVSDSFSSVPPVSNANLTLVAENTIMFRDQFRVTAAYVLRCILANEEGLNNISARSYHNFSQLCVYAVQSFIYKELLIKMDQAFLQGGQELGAMKSYVESLSDAEENYQTYLKEVWSPTAFMADVQNYDRFIRLQINSGL